jgi:hypothetical protein
MLENEPMNPADRELESTLRSLAPASKGVNPIAAAFAAGERAGHRSVRRWQSATALVLLLGIALQFRPGRSVHNVSPRDSGGMVAVTHVQPSPAQALSDQSVFMLQRAFGEKGVEALPTIRLAPHRSLTAADIF